LQNVSLKEDHNLEKHLVVEEIMSAGKCAIYAPHPL